MADDGYSRQRIPFSRNNFSGRVIESVELQQNVSSSGPGTPDVYAWGTPSRYVQGPPAPESRPQVTGYSTYEVTSAVQRSQEQESQSNEPAVSLRVIKRNTPNLARLQGLTEEERETQLQESRTAFEEEYVTMTDPTQRLLALCAPLLNVDVNLERKYKHLDIWRVFEANSEKPRFLHLTQGLGILEKYAFNLMKEARPPYWRTVKFTSSLVQIHVGSLIGSRDILSQMGYTEDIDDGVSFPLNVTEPDVQKLRELAPDLFFARYEIDALLVNSHPYYELAPPVPESEVQLPTLLRTRFPPSRPRRFPPRTSSTPLSVPQQATAVTAGSTTTVVTSPARTVLPYIQGNQPQQRTPSPIPAARRQRGNLSDRKGNNEAQQTTAERNAESEGDSEYEDAEDGILSSNADPNAQRQTDIECRICGESVASKFCRDCKDTFCIPCDEVYHKHRSRHSHVRSDLATPTMRASTASREVRTVTTVGTAAAGVVLGTIATVVAAGAVASSGQHTPGTYSSVEAVSVTSVSKDSRPRPVPAPRRNKTPLPSNQGAALSAQAPDPLSPRAPPTTSQRQQTTAFSPAQSPTSPRMPSVSQPVATTVTGQVQNQRREIRRPPPFAAHYNPTVTSQRGMDEIDNKPVVKSSPAPTARPAKIPVESKGLTPSSSTTVETGPALSCPNCFCLNPGGAKTCQICKKPLSIMAQQQASGQMVSQTQQTQGNVFVAASSGVAVDSDKWECEHCTYHNPITRRICEVCCKTSSNSPRPTGNSQFGGVAQGTSRETQHSEQQVISSQNVTNMAMHVNSQQMQSTNPVTKKTDQPNFQAAPVWSPPPQTAAAPPLRSAFPAQGNQQPGMWAGTVTSPPGQPFSRSFAAGGIVTQGGMHMTNTHGMVNPQMPGRHTFPGVTSHGYGGMTATGAFTRDAGFPFGPQGFPPPPPPPPPTMGSASPEVPATGSAFPSPAGSAYQQHQQQVSPGFPPAPPVVTWTERSDEALRRHQEEIYMSGLNYVEWLKKGEKEGFSAEEVNIASVLGIDDPQGLIHWLKTSWYDLIHRVMVELAIPENSQEIGNVSPEEVREALIECTGEVSRAKAKCIEIRKKKVRELQQEGVYAKTDCIFALDSSDGDTQKAILSLEKMSMGPLLRRVLDSCLPDHATQEEIAMALTRQTDHLSHHDKANFEAIVKDKNQNMDRRIRAILAEKDLASWGRAETAIKLIDMDFSLEDSVEAAISCGDLKRCLRYLKQECPLCCVEYPMSQMVTLLHCQDRVCRGCVSQYITITIKDKNILHLVCPCCGEPGNLDDEAVALEYFNNFDILIRGLVDKETHDLFQRKLRDRTLMKEPNFRWCSHCSSGFINEQPGQIKMMCPHCQQYSCFKCKRQWEDQHEGITCEQFAAWKEANDPEFQAAGLAAHLKRNGIVCPACKYRYDLSKGGCMHFKCAMCEHEFCSGCYNPFLNNHGQPGSHMPPMHLRHGRRYCLGYCSDMRTDVASNIGHLNLYRRHAHEVDSSSTSQNCRVSEHCTVRGLHAHHPRDCYFYLRDRDPEDLQELLRDNNARYNTEPPENQGNDDSDDEAAGAAAAAPAHCKVSEQKETVNGLVDGECGNQAPAGYAGLCRKHYIEYLVNLVNDNLLDPADIMSGEDLKRVLQRGFVNPPEKPNRMNDQQYRQLLLQTVKEQLQLPRKPPRKRILDEDDEVLNLQNNEDNLVIDSDDDDDDGDDDGDVYLDREEDLVEFEDYDPWDE